MAREHGVPVLPEPESDIIVALFVPLDVSYVRLLLGAIRVLEDESYYELDEDGTNTGALEAARIFKDRLITPLIESLSEV